MFLLLSHFCFHIVSFHTVALVPASLSLCCSPSSDWCCNQLPDPCNLAFESLWTLCRSKCFELDVQPLELAMLIEVTYFTTTQELFRYCVLCLQTHTNQHQRSKLNGGLGEKLCLIWERLNNSEPSCNGCSTCASLSCCSAQPETVQCCRTV